MARVGDAVCTASATPGSCSVGAARSLRVRIGVRRPRPWRLRRCVRRGFSVGFVSRRGGRTLAVFGVGVG